MNGGGGGALDGFVGGGAGVRCLCHRALELLFKVAPLRVELRGQQVGILGCHGVDLLARDDVGAKVWRVGVVRVRAGSEAAGCGG